MSFRFHWPWAAPQGLRIPSLRLYQQIIVLLLVIVLLPIGAATIAIYNLNKQAMRKQLTSFSQQLAQAIYQDITTEMSWQRRHLQTLQHVLQPATRDPATFAKTAPALLALDEALDGVALYKADGTLVYATYRDFAKLLPEWRFAADHPAFSPPSAVSPAKAIRGAGHPTVEPVYEVVYPTAPGLVGPETTYYLRAYLWTPATKPGQPATIIAFQRRFDYLKQLAAASQNSLHEQRYLVNESGQLMAGPAGLVPQQSWLSPKDFDFFHHLQPGVAAVFETNVTDNWQLPDGIPLPPPPGVSPKEDAEAKEQILDTVFVKLPVIGWGIIIESPYHVQQHFITRARTNTYFILLGALALALALGLVYVYGVTRNFRQLIKGIKAMAQGNYGRQIRLLTNVVTPYEIIYLTGEFNRMARKISEGWTTIQQANQQLAQLDQIKSNLIDTVSHELRTPLTNIKGYTDRLLRHYDALTPEVRVKSLKVIKQQTERLSRLVEDLLVIPDLEQHRLRIYLDEVALGPLVERVAQPFRERGEAHRLVVELPGEPVTVMADPDRLEQVLVNLLDNGWKYALEGGEIRVRVWQGEPEGGTGRRVVIEVSNPCEPMDPARVPGLFEKFARLEDGLTRTMRGSGLGLFITRELVEAMDGTITARVEENWFVVEITFG